eukprot:CAMPEP_0116881404 /NCGR_PEP_ID=MMETSP0463-20121206/13518_1 /TAXON_ID=181622 /ORGANISM="Strombidinopsis sp, Strain SopsisLIS2011" /LENGTH=129 /DNA_ID=CAMNT_0004533319 /DNA_START=316 /DNA_END=705 /DNA_ORIENTATION=+
MDPNDSNGGLYETWESWNEFDNIERSNYIHYGYYGNLDVDDPSTSFVDIRPGNMNNVWSPSILLCFYDEPSEDEEDNEKYLYSCAQTRKFFDMGSYITLKVGQEIDYRVGYRHFDDDGPNGTFMIKDSA